VEKLVDLDNEAFSLHFHWFYYDWAKLDSVVELVPSIGFASFINFI